MGLWRCGACTTLYAVGLSQCPRCHSTDAFEEETMAKIGRLTGPSNAALHEAQAAAVEQRTAVVGEHGPELISLPGDGDTVTRATPEEESSPGNSSEASTPKPQPSSKPSKAAARKPARTTESPSSPAPTEGSSAASTAGGPTAAPEADPAE